MSRADGRCLVCQKKTFQSEDEALEFALSLPGDGLAFAPYRAKCGRWHLTSKKVASYLYRRRKDGKPIPAGVGHGY